MLQSVLAFVPRIFSGSDMGEDPANEPAGYRPACAREETHAEPDADLVEIDGGRHAGFSLCGDADQRDD